MELHGDPSEAFDPLEPFRVGDALRNGFTRTDVDDPFFDRPFRGVRALKDVTTDDAHPAAAKRQQITRAAQRFVPLMSTHDFFSHTTAAVLWGIPLPQLPDADIDVSVLAPRRAHCANGVRGHQLHPRGVVRRAHPEHGFALTAPAATWALLGAELRHPYDLVAAADAIVRIDRLPGPTSRVLAPALASRAMLAASIPSRRRGVVALRAALDRVREGASSRMETWMRLTIVDGGLPEPVLDHDVYDDHRRFLGCVDAAYPAAKIAIEYEGDHHRTDPAQWQRDIEKHDDLVRAGWRVIRVTRAQLFADPAGFVARVRAALRAAR
ncbi:endonuclease domain-containing protein [Microbacterium sp. NPDC055357]